MTEIRKGSLDEFFVSAKETAKEIDKGISVTPKKTIWLETEDFIRLLKPSRLELIQHLRGREKMDFKTLQTILGKSISSLHADLQLLKHCGLVEFDTEINPGHGRKKVIRPLFGNETFELRAAV